MRHSIFNGHKWKENLYFVHWLWKREKEVAWLLKTNATRYHTYQEKTTWGGQIQLQNLNYIFLFHRIISKFYLNSSSKELFKDYKYAERLTAHYGEFRWSSISEFPQNFKISINLVKLTLNLLEWCFIHMRNYLKCILTYKFNSVQENTL